MDANKLKKLHEVGYSVLPCCYLCQHSHFPSMHSEWGTCSKHEYVHLKHVGPHRQMSIIKYGRCKEFEVAEGIEAGLGSYTEFFHNTVAEENEASAAKGIVAKIVPSLSDRGEK